MNSLLRIIKFLVHKSGGVNDASGEYTSKNWHRIIMPGLFLLIVSPVLFGQSGVVHTRNFIHQNFTRSYRLYVPAAYTGQAAWPLVINYHGYSSDATNQMFTHSKMNTIADTGHFLIAYPEGRIVQDLVFGGSNTGWNVLATYNASHDDVAFTDSLIDHVHADFNIDATRIHAAGFSNGGEMAFYLACELPNRIASVASVSNAMNDSLINSCQVTRPFSTLLMHGTADPFFPWGGIPGWFSSPSLTPSFWASQNICLSDSIVTELPDVVTTDNSTVTLIEYQGCNDSTEVLFYRVNNGGHGWPGTGPNIAGHTTRDINASSEIWNFFKRNPHPDIPLGITHRDPNITSTFQLQQNYPNPFNPTTTIEYSLFKNGYVTLSVFNLLGQEVATLVDALKPIGQYTVRFDATALTSGIYYYTLTVNGFQQSRKMVLIR